MRVGYTRELRPCSKIDRFDTLRPKQRCFFFSQGVSLYEGVTWLSQSEEPVLNRAGADPGKGVYVYRFFWGVALLILPHFS